MNAAVIVQARMTSTRLPGKILKQVLGRPLLWFLIERLKKISPRVDIIIATTTNKEDDPIIEFCRQNNVKSFRGSELDVLSRYAGAAREYKCDTVIRVTSDCPLIDPKVIRDAIKIFAAGNYDYVGNILKRTFPRGMDVEIFSAEMLFRADREAAKPSEREHVTPYFYGHPELFRLGDFTYVKDESRHRWTVDTPEDFELVSRLLETVYPDRPDFTLEDLLLIVAKHPHLEEINRHIEQKKVNA